MRFTRYLFSSAFCISILKRIDVKPVSRFSYFNWIWISQTSSHVILINIMHQCLCSPNMRIWRHAFQSFISQRCFPIIAFLRSVSVSFPRLSPHRFLNFIYIQIRWLLHCKNCEDHNNLIKNCLSRNGNELQIMRRFKAEGVNCHWLLGQEESFLCNLLHAVLRSFLWSSRSIR